MVTLVDKEHIIVTYFLPWRRKFTASLYSRPTARCNVCLLPNESQNANFLTLLLKNKS